MKHHYSSCLRDIFDKDIESIQAYIQVGREFWLYLSGEWKKLKITYVRSGAVFYRYEGEEKEDFFPGSSFMAAQLHPAVIYVNELAEYYANKYNLDQNKVAEDLRNAEWEDYDGRITITIKEAEK